MPVSILNLFRLMGLSKTIFKEFYDSGRELIEQDPDVFEIDRKVRYFVALAKH